MKNKNGETLSAPNEIADCLNEHFGSVGKEMAEKFENCENDVVNDPLEYVCVEQTESMYLYETDEYEIMRLISSLQAGKACGYDHISNKIVKETSNVIVPYLTKLFNSCMNQGVFPNAYKVAQVTPLFKGGDAENLNSYRPISLLPVLGKLLEKIISVRTIKFLEKFNLLSENQFGFRAKFSTEYAVLDIYEKLLKNLSDKKSTCAIFLDLAKAFDSVSHDILLKKLRKYGIRGNVFKLFESYLSSRSQFVKCGNTMSSLVNILFGVPQGSILGPLLFLIYINDLPHATNFFVRLFADDTFLCAQENNLEKLQTTVNHELSKVYNWLAANKLTLNVSKSKFMLITNRKNISKLSILINKEPLDQCTSYKYLGVFIDQDLSWKAHIDHVCGKIAKACGALTKIRHVIGIETLKNVYYALVNSYLRYGILIWGNASTPILKPLLTLINRAVRIISFAPFGNLNMIPIFQHLNFLDVNQTFQLETAKFIFKEVNGLLPISNIANYFDREPPQSNRPVRSTRNSCINVAPYDVLPDSTKKSIQMRKPQIWDGIPSHIKMAPFFSTFKKSLKAFIIQNE